MIVRSNQSSDILSRELATVTLQEGKRAAGDGGWATTFIQIDMTAFMSHDLITRNRQRPDGGLAIASEGKACGQGVRSRCARARRTRVRILVSSRR